MNAFSSRNPSTCVAAVPAKDSMAIFSNLEYILNNLSTIETCTSGISNKLLPPHPSPCPESPVTNLAEASVSEALMDILHRLQRLSGNLERINSAF